MNLLTLSMPGSDRTPVQLREGEAGIGSADDNQFVIQGPGVLPRHAWISINDDGAVLRPAESGAQLRLNERPVQSMAILGDGDRIELGENTTILVSMPTQTRNPSAPESVDDRATQVRRVPPKFLLRGAAGAHAGRLVPIYGRLLIGRGAECDLVLEEAGIADQHAVLKTLSEGLFLRDLGSPKGSFVNGKRVRDSELRHGDQLEFEQVRFLVQSVNPSESANKPGGAAGRTGGGRRKTAIIVTLVVLFIIGVVIGVLLR